MHTKNEEAKEKKTDLPIHPDIGSTGYNTGLVNGLERQSAHIAT